MPSGESIDHIFSNGEFAQFIWMKVIEEGEEDRGESRLRIVERLERCW